MSVRPILFSAPMVRALLAGTKTQTRRAIRDQRRYRQSADGAGVWTGFMGWQSLEWALENHELCAKGSLPGIAGGDLLWVREATTRFDKGTCDQWVWYRAGRNSLLGMSPDLDPDAEWPSGKEGPAGGASYNVASIHMPRWASRLPLLVTDVRVQRLQEISEDDARAEGIEPDDTGTAWLCYASQPKGQTHWAAPRESYRTLWDSINGPSSWAANPWVAAYTFTVHQQNVDDFLADQARAA
ncbi:hypothetical protein ACIKT0_01700 [Hansschlegelia beijingensis]|uniref:hypothetical protein n=1 Tax=Hansschlegelia beijingensis TaxID=1133344 RepID=UPI00387F2DA6